MLRISTPRDKTLLLILAIYSFYFLISPLSLLFFKATLLALAAEHGLIFDRFVIVCWCLKFWCKYHYLTLRKTQ